MLGGVAVSLLGGTCLAQTHHRISISAESDGMKKACLAQTHHRISVSAESDGIRKDHFTSAKNSTAKNSTK